MVYIGTLELITDTPSRYIVREDGKFLGVVEKYRIKGEKTERWKSTRLGFVHGGFRTRKQAAESL